MVSVFRCPSPSDPGYNAPMTIRCTDKCGRSFEAFKCERFLGPVCWNVDEKLDQRSKEDVVRARRQQKICVGVPTRNSRTRIVDTLRALASEIALAQANRRIDSIRLVVASSASDDGTDEATAEFLATLPDDINAVLLRVPVPGKSDALNVIYEFARRSECNLVVFVDDDVRLSSGGLWRTIDDVRSTQDIVIAGARYRAVQATTFWERIFSIGSARKRGQRLINARLMALDLEAYPKIPSYILSDDMYLSAYFMDTSASDPLRRIVISNEIRVSYQHPKTLFALLRRFERVLLGWEQILRFAPESVRGALRSALAESTWLGPLWELPGSDVSLGDALRLLIYSSLIQLLRWKIAAELRLRGWLGRPEELRRW